MQEYNNTDRQLHWLSQVIAKINRTFVPPKDDDSHTNLSFDPVASRLTGRWINTPSGDVMAGLNLNTLHFEWFDRTLSPLHETAVTGKSISQLEQEVAAFPESLGMDISGIGQPLHFEIPDYGFNQIPDETLLIQGMAKWKLFRQLANQSCFAFLGFLQSEGEVRIWPHHFDTGVYVQATRHMGIGFGLAMKDEMAGDAYFYIAGYKSAGSIQYRQLPALQTGKWITGDSWNGAILPISRLSQLSTVDAQLKIISFIRDTTLWYLNNSR
ncbi:MAG: hypothetical protein Kow00127_01730 [Bacteroidales bacterium]